MLEHREVLLGWDTIRPLAVMLSLIVLNTVACQLVWPSAGNFRATQLLAMVALVPFVALTGLAMLGFDVYTLLVVGSIDEKAVEKHFDLAESWLRGWKAPAVKVLSLGFINPRAIVGQEVRHRPGGRDRLAGWHVPLDGGAGGIADRLRADAVAGVRAVRRLTLLQRADLSLTGVVDRLAQDPRRLLRGVEAHRVLGVDEVEPPLRLALELASLVERSSVTPASSPP